MNDENKQSLKALWNTIKAYKNMHNRSPKRKKERRGIEKNT